MDSSSQFLSASINESYSKQFGRQASAGGTGIMPYYPANASSAGSRPRSFSAGSPQSVGMSGKKGASTSAAIKVIRVGSASKAYVKAKTPDDSSSKGCGLSRYKTELCRPFQDYGYCKYGDKCQFAHGEQELRVVPRHPKYKTELCRTYHTRGFCPYGSRCHFIHNLDETRKQEGGASTGKGLQSPTKKTLSFSLPISPSLDSGISSPDDLLGYGRRFEFPPSAGLEPTSDSDGSCGSGSDNDLDQSAFYDSVYADETMCGGTFFDGSDGVAMPFDQGSSPDPFMEFDALSTGSGSPMKAVSDGFSSAESDISELFGHMSVAEQAPPPLSPKSGRRLPVFDMLNSKSDTALLCGAVEQQDGFSFFPHQR